MARPWRDGDFRRGFGRRGWIPSRESRAGTTTVQPPPLGSLLATISKQELDQLCQNKPSGKPPKITNCKVIGSYNWLNRKCPTILIPGSPPAWNPVSTLKKLPEDSGSYFRDQNAARFAAHVFQPALEAILHHNPEFELNDLDIFACISTFRNLLRFVTDPDQGFRMIVEAIGATVFLVRREASPTEKIPGVFGYGHTFPEANTTWNKDVKGSESHQRILKYNFAGISCAIRYEGDGYLPNLHRPETSHVEDPAGDADDLLKPLQHSSVGSVAAEKVTVLAVETAGTAIPQSAMFDLKTRSARKEYTDVLRGELPRLWFAQVPNFIVGFHKRGLFSDVRVKNVQQEVEEWEEEQKPQLKRLAALLRALNAFARGQPSGRFELVFEAGNRELELREVGGQANCCISDELKTRCGGKSEEAQLEMEKTLDEGGTSGVGEDWDEEEARRSCGWSDDSESEKDFTACSASSCGY